MTDGPNHVLLQITFTNHDVEAIAEEADISLDVAMARAYEWAGSITDRAVERINEQLDSIIRYGQP